MSRSGLIPAPVPSSLPRNSRLLRYLQTCIFKAYTPTNTHIHKHIYCCSPARVRMYRSKESDGIRFGERKKVKKFKCQRYRTWRLLYVCIICTLYGRIQCTHDNVIITIPSLTRFFLGDISRLLPSHEIKQWTVTVISRIMEIIIKRHFLTEFCKSWL